MQEASEGSDPQGERLASLNEGVQQVRQALADEAVKRDERIRLANQAIADAQGSATKAIRAAVGAGLVAVLAIVVAFLAVRAAHTATDASRTANEATVSARTAISSLRMLQDQACADRQRQWTSLHDSIIEQNRVRAVSPVVLALLPAEFRAFVTPGTPEYLAAVAAANEKRDRALGRLGVKPTC